MQVHESRWPKLAFIVLAAGLVSQAAFAGKKTVEFSWSGQVRVRGEGHFDRDLDSDADDKRSPILQRTRLAAKAWVNDQVEAFVQLQDARVWGSEASTASNERNVDLHQGYLRVRPADQLELTLGRQEWAYGDQRLIGAFGWSNIGRAFDGVRARNSWDQGWVDAFWGRVARFAEGGSDETARDLLGLYLHFKTGTGHVFEPYVLAYRAGDDVASELADRMGNSDVLAFGARGAFKFDDLSLKAEGVYETGEIGGDDLSAYAFAATASGKFGDKSLWWKPMVGFDFATGDTDPTDGEREEFFNFFPTNHGHYGFIDFSGWRNVSSPWGGLAIGGNGHALLVKVHGLWLAEKTGRWSSAGGATLGFDPSGESGTEVGQNIDVSYKRTLFDALKLHLGYSWFNPGEFAKATRGGDATQFVYASGTVNF